MDLYLKIDNRRINVYMAVNRNFYSYDFSKYGMFVQWNKRKTKKKKKVAIFILCFI